MWLVYLGAAVAVMLNSSLIDGALLMRSKGWSKALRFLVLFWPLACSVVILNGFRHVLSIPAELRANWIFQITESQGRAEWMSRGGALRDGVRDRPDLPDPVSGCGIRLGLADGDAHDRCCRC